jgi:Uma2 family endonuclease
MNPPASAEATAPARLSRPGEPTWEVAQFFPRQGDWTEADYLALESSRFVELANGCLEVLPMPTYLHHLIVKFIFVQLETFLGTHPVGTVVFAPLPVRLGERWYREPDLVFLSNERRAKTDRYPEGADLVIEVVSEGDESRKRDLVVKRQEYAAAGISEYWIVDPAERQIVVLTLEGSSYREAGTYRSGEAAASVLLPGFSVAVDEVFSVDERSA